MEALNAQPQIKPVKEICRYIPREYTNVITREGLNGIVYAGELAAIAYKGKSSKHAWHYSFKTVQQMNAVIEEFFSDITKHQKRITDRKEQKKNFVTSLQPGDILYTSWGYEQTNTEFFQVLTVKGNTVTVREISSTVTENGFMSGYAVPVKNAFLDDKPVLTRRVIPGLRTSTRSDSIKIDNVRYAWIADREKYYVSWYG